MAVSRCNSAWWFSQVVYFIKHLLVSQLLCHHMSVAYWEKSGTWSFMMMRWWCAFATHSGLLQFSSTDIDTECRWLSGKPMGMSHGNLMAWGFPRSGILLSCHWWQLQSWRWPSKHWQKWLDMARALQRCGCSDAVGPQWPIQGRWLNRHLGRPEVKDASGWPQQATSWIYMDLMGTNMLVQHVHLVSNPVGVTTWRPWQTSIHSGWTTTSSIFQDVLSGAKILERFFATKRIQRVTCVGAICRCFPWKSWPVWPVCPVCHRYRCVLQLGYGFRTTSFTFRNWVPLPNSRATQPPWGELDVMVSRGEGSAFPGVRHVLIFPSISPVFHDIS